MQVHSRSGRARLWTVRVEGNAVHTSWGQFGGKMQLAVERLNGVNEGRANYMAPEQYAVDRAREMCRKKTWEGYREVGNLDNGVAMKVDGTPVFLDPPVQATVDFDNLPLSLSFYKPDNTLSAKLEEKLRLGQAWYTRKRNGMMKVLCKDSGGELHIYSRRMLRQHDDEQGTEYTWDDRFPHLIGAIEPHIPPCTILLGELVVQQDTVERFDLAQSYIKSLTPKAVADMESSGLFPFFYCWDVAFWGGDDLVSRVSMRERLTKYIHPLQNLAREMPSGHKGGRLTCFMPLEVVQFGNPDEALAYAKLHRWEGFVVVDPDAPGYGNKAYNFKGKPDRPGAFCGKLKPSFEDDFVAIWDPERGYGERSTKGSRAGGIKSVGLYQHDKAGQLVFIANVSSGLTKELLAQLPNSSWPQVWKVSYKGRRYVSDGDDTNALDFPAFEEIRTDKQPQECVNERL